MITSVKVGSVTLSCDYLNKPIRPKIVRIEIPGRDASIVQNLGNRSKDIEIRGILSGANKDTDKSTLEGYVGSNQTYTDTDETFTMVVTAVDIATVGGQPNHYRFVIKGIKYEQT